MLGTMTIRYIVPFIMVSVTREMIHQNGDKNDLNLQRGGADGNLSTLFGCMVGMGFA